MLDTLTAGRLREGTIPAAKGEPIIPQIADAIFNLCKSELNGIGGADLQSSALGNYLHRRAGDEVGNTPVQVLALRCHTVRERK